MKEIEEQRLGRNKQTAINHTYICSGKYRKKFDAISDNMELSRLLYNITKEMLMHRAGTEFEDMYSCSNGARPRSASTEIPKKLLICGSIEISGYTTPFSHLLIVW